MAGCADRGLLRGASRIAILGDVRAMIPCRTNTPMHDAALFAFMHFAAGAKLLKFTSNPPQKQRRDSIGLTIGEAHIR
jgi:hypothetical protein